MSSVVQQGLVLRDRIFSVSVLLPDKPGELSRVADAIAKQYFSPYDNPNPPFYDCQRLLHGFSYILLIS